MINLDDFNLDAISEKAKDNEEVIDEDEALQRAGYTEVADDNYEVGEESLFSSIIGGLLTLGRYEQAVVNWIKGTKDLCFYRIQIKRADIQQGTITVSSAFLFYLNPKKADKAKQIQQINEVVDHPYKVRIPSSLNVVKSGNFRHLYVEDLPKLVPDLFRDIKRYTNTGNELYSKVGNRITYMVTQDFTKAIIQMCEKRKVNISYKKVESHKDHMDTYHYGKESYDNLVDAYDLTRLLPGASAGMEAFNEPQMGVVGNVRPANLPAPFSIRTTDGKNFRIYFSTMAVFLPPVVSALCRFLDTRKEGETVTFVLGSGLDDRQSHAVGAIVSAMSTSRAEVCAVAAGWCNVTETILWVSAKRSEIYKYGALTFGVSEITKEVDKLKIYFNLFLNKGKQLGLITDEDIKNIWDTNQTKLITYEDYLKLQSVPQGYSDQDQKDSEAPLDQF